MWGPPMDEATRNQIAAADPAANTWLVANAGSGKTQSPTGWRGFCWAGPSRCRSCA